MFCSKCGTQLSEGAKFCSNCGATVVSASQLTESTVPPDSSQSSTQKASDTAPDHAAIDIETLICHSPYYIEEFAKIEKGQPSRFNWMAFFFAPYLLLYRRMAKHKMFSRILICMIVMIFAGLFTSLLLVNSLFTIFGVFLGLVSGVLMLVFSIQCGKKFNMEYYKHLNTMMEKIKEPVALKKAVLPGWKYPIIFGVAYAAISIAVQMLGGTFALGSFIVGINEAIENDNSSKTSTKSTEPATYYAMGETAESKGIAITVLDMTTSPGDEFISPKSGCEYVTVFVEIQNMSDGTLDYNELDFKMQNSKGQLVDPDFLFSIDPQLSAGSLVSGGEIRGTISFEQPIGDTGLILNYYENSLFDDEPSIQFTLSQTKNAVYNTDISSSSSTSSQDATPDLPSSVFVKTGEETPSVLDKAVLQSQASGEETQYPTSDSSTSYNPGETHFYKDIAMRISNFGVVNPAGENPAEGNHLLLKIELRNLRKEPINYDPDFFLLQDSNGLFYDHNPTNSQNINNGILNPGESAELEVDFSLPADEYTWTVCFFADRRENKPSLQFNIRLASEMPIYIGDEMGAIDIADFVGTNLAGPSNFNFLGSSYDYLGQYDGNDPEINAIIGGLEAYQVQNGIIAHENTNSTVVAIDIIFAEEPDNLPRGYYYYSACGISWGMTRDEVKEKLAGNHMEDENEEWITYSTFDAIKREVKKVKFHFDEYDEVFEAIAYLDKDSVMGGGM